MRAKSSEKRFRGTDFCNKVSRNRSRWHDAGVAAERTSFIALVELGLHYNDSGSLKGKRKEVSSLKALLRQRFGASVAETGGHDTWQRTTLLCALVGDREIEHQAEALARFAESRHPEGCSVKIDLRSLGDVLG